MTNTELENLVKKHVSDLGEHVSSVRIFVSCPNPNNEQHTLSFDYGSGNFYAQLGHIIEWLERQKEAMRIEERASSEKDDEL